METATSITESPIPSPELYIWPNETVVMPKPFTQIILEILWELRVAFSFYALLFITIISILITVVIVITKKPLDKRIKSTKVSIFLAMSVIVYFSLILLFGNDDVIVIATKLLDDPFLFW